MVMNFLAQIFAVMVATALFTLLERKTLGYIQLRKGPNKPPGIIIPLADAIKLMTKETIIPYTSNKTLFFTVPVAILMIPMIMWLYYPSNNEFLSSNVSVITIIALSSISVYGTLFAGWSSNSKYSFLGSIRAIAQTISYEVSFMIVILHVVIFSGLSIKNMFIPVSLTMMMMLLVFFVVCLAETNRSPFDFTEGESELVSGFNTEYSSSLFLIIFLSEYMSILFMSSFISMLFLSTNMKELFLFTGIMSFLYIWARGSLPRFRYDQLMFLAWKSFLPISLASLMLYMCV